MSVLKTRALAQRHGPPRVYNDDAPTGQGQGIGNQQVNGNPLEMNSNTAMPAMYAAVHEAGHAVVALVVGGFAERIWLAGVGEGNLGGCGVSWPEDGVDRLDGKLLTLAGGVAATAIYTRKGIDTAIFATGMNDVRRMSEITGNSGTNIDTFFRRASVICRQHWPAVLAIAGAARQQGELTEREILDLMDGAV